MANEIKLITFADSEVTATDDAYVYETATGSGGVINGCVVTIKNASELHITGGNGILCGRKFTIFDSDLPVTLSSSGTLLGRLYIHMDLSNASTPIQLMIETGASLTPVQQDADVNATNGVYEINLATFDVDTSTISNLVDVAPKAEPHEVLNTVEDCEVSTNPGDIAGASCIAELNSSITTIQDTVINQRAYKNEVLYYSFSSTASTQAEFQKDIARQMPALCNAAIFQGTWAGHNFYFGDIRRVGSTYYLFYAVSGSTPTAVQVTL